MNNAVTWYDVLGVLPDAGLQDIRAGLHVASVALTERPMPVEGLVVGQTPAPGDRVHTGSTLTVQVWHPPEPAR